ncbi:hypothetical protein EG329_002497 [Mollisiaceae sp. DMI_Dod_QoI]|nr:hypothetical protein EG329_002497 [Helotiales sp. DMI_Dod_QoI]
MFHSWLASTNAADGSASVDVNDNGLTCQLHDSEYQGFPASLDAVLDDFSAPLAMEWGIRQQNTGACLVGAPEGSTRSASAHNIDRGSMFWIGDQSSPLANDSVSAPPQHISVSAAKKGDASSVSSAMKNASKLVLASWQALRDATEDLPTLLNRKKATTMSSLTIGNCIWATIESYAINLAKGSLPPFIHRSSCTNENEDRCLDFGKLSEPLANCFNIIPLYVRKTPTTTALVFQTLILEIQRLYNEFQTYNELNLLSALQALTIYVIIIAADPKRCANISVFVGIAMQEICVKVNEDNQLSNGAAFPSWEDWIRSESRTR